MSLDLNRLVTRLATLSASLKQTQQLIQQLARSQTSASNPLSIELVEDDDSRNDLSASIHEQLRTFEDELEILRLDITDLDSAQTHASGRSSRRSTTLGRESQEQREIARCLSGCEKLAQDLKLYVLDRSIPVSYKS